MQSDSAELPIATPTTAEPSSADCAERLLSLLRNLLREIRPTDTGITLDLDSHVDRDLALDSLTRTELLRRIEIGFQVQLDERVLLAETPRDLLELILAAQGEPEATTLAAQWTLAPTTTTAASGFPDRASTLIEMLDWHVQRQPERVAIQIYGNDESIDTTFSYAALWQGAQAVAVGLRARGLLPGQTVAIMLPTGRDYFLSFFGILLAGGVPVPIYPPVRPSQIEDQAGRGHRRVAARSRRTGARHKPAPMAAPEPARHYRRA